MLKSALFCPKDFNDRGRIRQGIPFLLCDFGCNQFTWQWNLLQYNAFKGPDFRMLNSCFLFEKRLQFFSLIRLYAARRILTERHPWGFLWQAARISIKSCCQSASWPWPGKVNCIRKNLSYPPFATGAERQTAGPCGGYTTKNKIVLR